MEKIRKKKYFYLILIVLVVVGVICFAIFQQRNTSGEMGNPYDMPQEGLVQSIIFQGITYIPAKCITPSSSNIIKIGKTDTGIDVYSDKSIPNEKKDNAGILIKKNDGYYQCYMKR